MSIRRHRGFWTIYCKDQPVLACTSFMSAWRLVWELRHENA
jgi:hypothetical protein